MIDLPVNIAIPVYSGLQIAGKCIYAGNTDTVKSSGNLIRTLSELTAGIQPGKTDLQGTLSDLRMDVNGNTSSVILNRADLTALVVIEDDVYLITEPGHGLINTVIKYFVDKMVQSINTRGTDVHARAKTHMFKTFKDLNFTAVVFL